jgi:site-specific DNA-cytosine methylase
MVTGVQTCALPIFLPVECERLQGYPDGWTERGHDGKEISDTRRYQMLGNSVAVPCVAYIMLGIAGQFFREEDA